MRGDSSAGSNVPKCVVNDAPYFAGIDVRETCGQRSGNRIQLIDRESGSRCVHTWNVRPPGLRSPRAEGTGREDISPEGLGFASSAA